ncbi:thiol reductant ABC exporter subunit CydD [Schleiferilactobacillus shenzhenensis]|uniref:CydC n=1 Tax=Schleiferilactobacillus shenzhenensis LY-73 TaxID=1231336 RepID=U4TZ73_9LACO|nr:thiol reductant ABC exporter subunit CydD [Schleiferilactobacillus shenzhenensis]ERL66612.1 CydC [Schleiferilactobacillus shenzhenensis LY-73]
MIDKSLFQFPRMRQQMMLLSLLSFIQAAAIVVQAMGLTQALVAIWQLRKISALAVPVLVFFSAFIVRQLMDVAKNAVATHYADENITRLRPQIQAQYFRLGPAYLHRTGTGSAVTVLIDGLDQVKTYIQTVLPKMTDMIFIPTLTLIYVWYENWLSGLVLFLMLPLIFFFMAILGLAARAKSDQQYADFTTLNNSFVDTILGLPTLKVLGIADQYEDQIYTVSERFRKKTMSVIRVALTSTFALDFFTTLAIAIIAVFLGFRLINGTVTLYPALVSLILAPEFFLPIRQFGDDYHATLNGKNALQQVNDLLATPAPAVVPPIDWPGWGTDSTLSLSGVSFRYPDAAKDTFALQDIGFTAQGMEKIAIVGRSGSGKSTMMNLLAGFNQPASGAHISLDGHDLTSFNQPQWQDSMSYIPQEPYIFSASIADNIRFYVPDASDAAVAAAADQAGLTDWLGQLPDGLATMIGEGQRGISGGQGQRIALARVLLDSRRKILLFDEPTAHLDIETEYALKQTLVPLFADHLVIFATHRLHWLPAMDQIIVLENGRISEQGRLSDLRGRGGALDRLIEEMGGKQNAVFK